MIGFDNVGRAIELVFIHTDTGILIFHANYLTTGFRKEYNDGLRRSKR
ncbi:toxin-antitoxin system toxin subunit [Arcanobacterium bovis]|uniref:Toxin-antitoxin system toxin subunit n=1 Tax=Arcanobacterium bovis TaxID=2529275 RepID=A0A4Q9V0T6_9ACTO|nr:toxin-antitoxin system toxin subunit [Arcanobacterium bovis]